MSPRLYSALCVADSGAAVPHPINSELRMTAKSPAVFRAIILSLLGLVALAPLAPAQAGGGDTDAAKPKTSPAVATSPKKEIALPEGMKAYSIAVPNTELKIRMVPVPHPKSPFWMSETEITWEVFDEFVFEDIYHPEDFKKMKGPDAVARPSKPYIPPDRGYGHEGFAAISLSSQSARNFAAWLAKKTKTSIRLPREDEWEHACLAGAKGPFAFDEKKAREFCWWYETALKRPIDPNEDPDFHDRAAQPVGKLKANAYGLFDMHGNVAEWVDGRDGKPVLKGGSWQDDFGDLAVTKRAAWRDSWQQTDPQIPKSSWWLSDAPFAGMRILRPWKPSASAAKKPQNADKSPSKDKPDTKKQSTSEERSS
jgi:formylglycine-generating enzyme required for sulfatase activity